MNRTVAQERSTTVLLSSMLFTHYIAQCLLTWQTVQYMGKQRHSYQAAGNKPHISTMQAVAIRYPA
jgi:hypothetical protein